MHVSTLARLLFTPLAVSVTALHAQQASAPAPTPAADMGQIEITSGRDNDTQQRRESTASKIVITREDLDALIALLGDERPSRFFDFNGPRTDLTYSFNDIDGTYDIARGV